MCQEPKRNNLRIALLSGALSAVGGGAPRSIATHTQVLQTQGVGVTIFTGYNKRLPITADQFGLDCEIVASPLIGPSVLCLAVGALRQLFRRAREFDVIHLNGSWNLMTFIASRIACRRNVPYIVSPRSHLGAYHFTRFHFLKSILYSLFEKKNIRDALCIHLTSEWEHKTSQAALGDAPVVVVPNAVELQEFREHLPREQARRLLGLDEDEFLVVSFGRLGRQKNPGFLLKAFHKASLPANAHLFFVGPPEKRTLKQLLDYRGKAGLENRVHFVDFVTGQQRRCWLAAGNVFALPSFDENFCVALVEAAASGTPCLVSPFVGAVEFLPPEVVSVQELDLDSWTNVLREFYSRRPPQRFLSEEILAQFHPSTIGKQWIQVYDQLLHKAACGRSSGTGTPRGDSGRNQTGTGVRPLSY